MADRPFKFLDSYGREDADIFFGRDKEIEDLHTKVFQGRLLLVYGVSGSGKSSLVNCGLGSRFKPTDWLPINVRRKRHIVEDLTEAVSAACVTPLTGKAGLVKALRSVYLDHFMPVYLIIDQLEELFIFGDDEEQKAFIAALAKVLAASEELNVKIILVVREEFLAPLTGFEETVPELFENRARLERMTWRNAVQAIEGPCVRAGIELEQGFSEGLLGNIAAGRNDVELTFLQVYLDRVYSLMEESGSRRFSLGLLERIGAVSDVLGQFLDEQLATFADPERAITVLKSFVSVRGTKKLITAGEAGAFSREIGKPMDDEDVMTVVRRAVDLRLLKDQDDQGRYELRHDALAATIYAKISLFEKELIEIKQFVEQAHATFLKRRTLLSPEDLKYIAPYEDRLFLGKEHKNFIAQSRGEATRKQRRRVVFGISIASVVVVALSILTVRAQQAKVLAEQERDKAGRAERAAILAKEESDRARAIADSLRDRAIQNAAELEIAIQQKDEARIASLVNERKALQSMAQEEEARRREQERTMELEEQVTMTEEARQKEAEAKEDSERRLRLEASSKIAQNSSAITDEALRGLLAIEALRLRRENGGSEHAPEVVTALFGALRALELDHPMKVGGLAGETRFLRLEAGGTLLAMGNKAHVQRIDMNALTRSTVLDLSHKGAQRAFLSPTGRSIMLAGSDGSIEVWSTASGERVAGPERQEGGREINALSAFDDGGPYVSGDRQGRVVVWRRTGTGLEKVTSIELGGLPSFTLVGGAMACINGTSTLSVIQSDGSERRIQLPGSAVRAVAGPAAGTLFLGTKETKALRVNVATGEVSTLSGASSCDAIAISPDGRWLAIANSVGKLTITDLDQALDPVVIDADGVPRSMAFGDGDRLYLGYEEGRVARVLFTAEGMRERICGILAGRKRRFDPSEWKRYIDIGELRDPCAP